MIAGTLARAPEMLLTERLRLRRPTLADADAVFTRYASDPAVTQYMSWPTHRRLDDTRAYIGWCDREWLRWPAGSYLVFARDDRSTLLGGTGLVYHRPGEAVTGYVLARDAWGSGYATECLRAMIDLARQLGLLRLEAVCHLSHTASAHVMEKCGMRRDGLLTEHTEFPNLLPGVRQSVLRYTIALGSLAER